MIFVEFLKFKEVNILKLLEKVIVILKIFRC
jgi:hypothetical protein